MENIQKIEICDTCKANRVCDHNRYGFETCGCYIPADVVPRSVITEIFAELDTFVKLLCTDNDDVFIYSEMKKKYIGE